MDKEERGGRGEEDHIFIPEVPKHSAEQVCFSQIVESRALSLF